MKNSPVTNWIKFIATGALLLSASSAIAGIIFIPLSGRYIAPETAPVTIQSLGDQTILVSTTGLTGEWTIQGSEVPPGYDLPATAQAVLPFEQDLGLVIDLAAGTVTASHPKAQNTVSMGLGVTLHTSTVSGNAVCLPLNGSECGQLVVDLEVQGVVSDPNDPAVVGRVRMQMLGSLIWGGIVGGGIWGGATGTGIWASMSANVKIGDNDEPFHSVLEFAACQDALVIC